MSATKPIQMIPIDQAAGKRVPALLRRYRQPLFGMALLGAAFCAGYLFRYAGSFSSDEGDNLAIAFLVSRGQTLYREAFTQHLPFPYLWFAALFKLIPTLKAARLSVLIFQLAGFGLLMRLSRSVVAIGLAAVVWSAIGQVFYVNMAIYPAFTGVSLVVVAAAVLAAYLRPAPLDRLELALTGLFAAAAVLCDPLAVPPVALAFLALALSPAGWRRAAGAGVVASAFGLAVTAYLALTGAIPDFIYQVLTFNSQVYSKYYTSGASHLLDLPKLLLNGLWIFAQDRWSQPEVLAPIPGASQAASYWLAWFSFRLAVIAASLYLVARRKTGAGLFLYGFAALLLLRGDGFFRQAPFAMLGLLCAAWLLGGAVRTFGEAGDLADERLAARLWRLSAGGAAAALILTLAVIVLAYRVQHPTTLSYFDQFGAYESRAAEVKAAACGQEVELGYYPGYPLIYMYTGYRPVARYTYIWPWIAEVGLPEVITALQRDGEKALVFIDPQPVIWGIPTTQYLAKLSAFLEAHYVKSGQFYLSPSLAAACGLSTR